jgi:hypothetical protein
MAAGIYFDELTDAKGSCDSTIETRLSVVSTASAKVTLGIS